MSLTYAALVTERDDYRVAKRPSRTFLDVLRVLVETGGARSHEIAHAAGTCDWAGAFRVLERMRRLDLARRRPAPGGDGVKGGWYYWPTEDAHALARTELGR